MFRLPRRPKDRRLRRLLGLCVRVELLRPPAPRDLLALLLVTVAPVLELARRVAVARPAADAPGVVAVRARRRRDRGRSVLGAAGAAAVSARPRRDPATPRARADGPGGPAPPPRLRRGARGRVW